MAKRVKLTAFSRFLIVMIFLVPLAYIGASYYNGQDGIQNIRNLIGIDGSSESTTTANKKEDAKPLPTVTENNDRYDDLEQRIEKLEEEVLDLKSEIAEMKSR